MLVTSNRRSVAHSATILYINATLGSFTEILFVVPLVALSDIAGMQGVCNLHMYPVMFL
jgi:hypothetical protein